MTPALNWQTTDITLDREYPKGLNWDLVIVKAIEVRLEVDDEEDLEGLTCTLSKEWSSSGFWFVRRLDFSDGCSWVFRFGASSEHEEFMRELCTMQLVRERTEVPVPPENYLRVDWVMMEYIPVDSVQDGWGMDLYNRVLNPPKQLWPKFHWQLADVVVQIASIRFPKIGAISFNIWNGEFTIVPVPGLGGPWDTAAEFFEDLLKRKAEGHGLPPRPLEDSDESRLLTDAYNGFLPRLIDLTETLPFRKGPFPLDHRALTNQNILADADCNIRSVTGWRFSMTVPWELATFSEEMIPGLYGFPSYSRVEPPLCCELKAAIERWTETLRKAEEDHHLDHMVSTLHGDKRIRALALAFNKHRKSQYGRYDTVLGLFEESGDFGNAGE